jgi:hypothetical protein
MTRIPARKPRGCLDGGRLLSRIGPIRLKKVPIVLTLASLTRFRGA